MRQRIVNDNYIASVVKSNTNKANGIYWSYTQLAMSKYTENVTRQASTYLPDIVDIDLSALYIWWKVHAYNI